MLKVLIADDEAAILQGYKKIINWEKCGFTIVAEASDGEEAIQKAKAYRPDLILIDVNMPRMDGLKAIAKIQQQRLNCAIIIVSGYDDFALVRAALRLKVTDYLLKPVDFEQLLHCLERVRLGDMHIEKSKQAPDLSATKSTIAQMIAYIDQHLSDETLSLAGMAAAFHMNTSYLSAYFKAKTQINFCDYVNTRRILKAEMLLLQTDCSIAEIAERVGLQNFRYFTRVFKKIRGITPSQFRVADLSSENENLTNI